MIFIDNRVIIPKTHDKKEEKTSWYKSLFHVVSLILIFISAPIWIIPVSIVSLPPLLFSHNSINSYLKIKGSFYDCWGDYDDYDDHCDGNVYYLNPEDNPQNNTIDTSQERHIIIRILSKILLALLMILLIITSPLWVWLYLLIYFFYDFMKDRKHKKHMKEDPYLDFTP